MSPLSVDLADRIRDLTNCLAIEEINEEYYPDRFGDGILTMKGVQLSLRIVSRNTSRVH